MSLFRIAYRQLCEKPWSFAVTTLVLAVATGLVLVLRILSLEVDQALKREAGDCDLVVGAQGSRLQSVLSSIYYLDRPTGNIQKTVLPEVAQDPRVSVAAPISVGDNYQGFRIVGTTHEFFRFRNARTSSGSEGELMFQLEEGRVFDQPFEAVVGSRVAEVLGIKIGDSFSGTHGLEVSNYSESHDQFPYRVVGVLAPSETSHDAAIFVDQRSVWLVHQQELKAHSVFGGMPFQKKKKASDEITAILVQLKSAGSRFGLVRDLEKDFKVTCASPLEEIHQLMTSLVQPVVKLLSVASLLVNIITAITLSTLVVILAQQQLRSFAVARALGATMGDVFTIQCYNIGLRLVVGLVIGTGLGYMALWIIAAAIARDSGLYLEVWHLPWSVALNLLGIYSACFVAMLLPVLVLFKQQLT